jgi:hypothetical protein
MARRCSAFARPVIAALLLSLALSLAGSSPRALAQDRAWDRPLTEARAAAARGRHAEAAALFARGDALLGGFPYEDGAQLYGEDGRWVHEDTRGPIRAAFQCAWALEVLASPRPPESDEVSSRAYEDAIARARLSCSPAEQARAAHLLGDDLQAALRVLDEPTERRATTRASAGVSEASMRWAEAARAGRIPLARDANEALRFVTAHARAAHGLDARCDPPFARPLQVPRARDPDLAKPNRHSQTAFVRWPCFQRSRPRTMSPYTSSKSSESEPTTGGSST